MKIGILFGGPSRERNRSLLNARSVYALMDRALFQPVPILVDIHGQLFKMEPTALEAQSISHLIKGNQARVSELSHTQEKLSDQKADIQWKELIEKIEWTELPTHIDFAWIAMQGTFAEDGQIQERLEDLSLHYNGFSPAVCRYTADHTRLRGLLDLHDFSTTPAVSLNRSIWESQGPKALQDQVRTQLNHPIIVCPGDIPTQAGHTLLEEPDDLERFELAINRAFFQEILPIAEWQDRSHFEQQETIRLLADLEDGLGFPIRVTTNEGTVIKHSPNQLFHYFNEIAGKKSASAFGLQSALDHLQEKVLIEQAPEGIPFTCTVVAVPESGLLVLPPQVPAEYAKANFLDNIDQLAIEVFQRLQLQAYAQLSGYSLPDGQFIVTKITSHPDWDITSPAWAGFGQIGISPSQALTLLIQASLESRPSIPVENRQDFVGSSPEIAQGVALVCGGFGYGGSLSLESAREIFQRLDGKQGYRPLPIWQTATENGMAYFRLPLQLFLTASMPELHQACSSPAAPHQHAESLDSFSKRYSSSAYPKRVETCPVSSWPAIASFVWSTIQEEPSGTNSLIANLETIGLPHNGASRKVAPLFSDKYQLLQTLERNNIAVPHQFKLDKSNYDHDAKGALDRIEHQIGFPLVAHPLSGHYSSGVQLINSRSELKAYTRLLFRPTNEEGLEARRMLRLPPGSLFPQSNALIVSPQITKKAGHKLAEISTHVYCTADKRGSVSYQWLPISEVKPNSTVLRPNEKYEQALKYSNTPARFASDEGILWSIQQQLEKAVRLLDLKCPANLDAFVHLQEGKAPEVYLFDLNLQPPFTRDTMMGIQLAAAGINPAVFLEQVITQGLRPSKTDNQNQLAEPKHSVQPTYNTSTMNEDTTPATPDSSNSGRSNAGQPESLQDRLMAKAKVYLNETWQFLKSPVFLRNFAGILLMVFGSIFIVRWSLKLYTRHGESIQVPDYTGMDMRDAVRKAEKQNFKIVAIDSFFDSRKRPNTIYQQDPMPNQRAKEGRTIYVSKYRAQADSVLLPTLMRAGYNFDQYRTKLRRIDVKAQIKDRIFDNKQEENTVLHFFHNGLKVTDDMLRNGFKVPRGSTLEFVITERITNQVAMPDLICKRFDEAKFLLTSSNLVLGQTFGAEGVESSAFVYRQQPEFTPGQMVIKGSSIDLYLKTTLPSGCPEPSDVLEEEPEDFN